MTTYGHLTSLTRDELYQLVKQLELKNRALIHDIGNIDNFVRGIVYKNCSRKIQIKR